MTVGEVKGEGNTIGLASHDAAGVLVPTKFNRREGALNDQ